MLSIIVCSRYSHPSKNFIDNIKETIGMLVYELIWIDNNTNNKSIFQAYREGCVKAHYPILVFIHEDIVFRSKDWGIKIIEALKDNNIGIVGVMGSCYIGKDSPYYHLPGPCIGHIIQGKYTKKGYVSYIDDRFQYNQLGNEVVVLDGMFLATRKVLFDDGVLKWDEWSYTGFHFYDMDICMQSLVKGYKNKVVKEIMLEHKSLGTNNVQFYDNCIKFHKKWNAYLPVKTALLTDDILNEMYISFIQKYKEHMLQILSYKRILNMIPYKLITKLLVMCGKSL